MGYSQQIAHMLLISLTIPIHALIKAIFYFSDLKNCSVGEIFDLQQQAPESELYIEPILEKKQAHTM